MTVGVKQGMLPRVITGDRDAVLRQIGWCAAVGTLVNCHCKLEENQVGNVRGAHIRLLDQGRRHGFKSGGQNVAREKKNFVPPHLEKWGYNFLHVRGTSKQITISIEYTEICCLVVVLIGLYYRPSRPIMNQRRRQFHVSVVNKIGTACMHQVLYSS